MFGSGINRLVLKTVGGVVLASTLAAGPTAQPTAAYSYGSAWGTTWAEHNVTSLTIHVRMAPSDVRLRQDMAYRLWIYSYANARWTSITGGWVSWTWEASGFENAMYYEDIHTWRPAPGKYKLMVEYAWLFADGWEISPAELPCVNGYWTTACQNPFWIYSR